MARGKSCIQIIDLSGTKPRNVCKRTYSLDAADMLFAIEKALPEICRITRKGAAKKDSARAKRKSKCKEKNYGETT